MTDASPPPPAAASSDASAPHDDPALATSHFGRASASVGPHWIPRSGVYAVGIGVVLVAFSAIGLGAVALLIAPIVLLAIVLALLIDIPLAKLARRLLRPTAGAKARGWTVAGIGAIAGTFGIWLALGITILRPDAFEGTTTVWELLGVLASVAVAGVPLGSFAAWLGWFRLTRPLPAVQAPSVAPATDAA